MKKNLIVYFSHSGNTREIAERIQAKVGGEIFELQTVDPYPTDYNACVDQAKREIAAGHKPALKNKPPNIADYDTVFIGSPVWWYTVAPPVSTFLSEHDLSGKTIAPFCTHEGSGLSKCAVDIAKQAPGAAVTDGVAFRGGRVSSSQKELEEWLRKIAI